MNPVTLTINGRTLTAAPEQTILEVARQHGINIPTLCYHKELTSTGSCWICIVEIKGRNRFIPSCSTRVSDGMVIETDNAELAAMRRQSLERIIAMHCGDCLAPCERACPAGCDIPEFIAAIASERDRDAIESIRKSIPLPGILGRVCPAPCEDACRRHGVDEPVSVCSLKRFAADTEMADGARLPERKASSGKRVAIIGAGPAGLTAAWFLLLEGHEVTIIDAGDKAGGMMRYGIPKFRLPETVIEADIEPLVRMGAAFRFSTVFGRDTDWNRLQEDHDALLLAIGASQATRLDIPGEELDGVKCGIGFLREIALGNAPHPGSSVVVIGGGNTAVDAARSALRLGADSVTILYRRGRQEMPANRLEIDEAAEEGIQFRLLAAPLSIEKSPEGLVVRAVAMQLGEPDASGRRRPVPVADSEFTLVADTVITATGQYVAFPAEAATGLAPERNGTIRVDPASMQTTKPGIFAAGDCVSGPDLAVQAVGQGKVAAMAIDRYLRGVEPLGAVMTSFNASYGERDKVPSRFYDRTEKKPRIPVPGLSAESRRKSFSEAVTGFEAEEARREAQRCLQCRCQAVDDCRLRDLATSAGIASNPAEMSHDCFSIDSFGGLRFEREKCVDCGICVRTLESSVSTEIAGIGTVLTENCPTGAICSRIV